MLFDDVVGNASDSQGFTYVNALVLSHQADETPQLAVTKASKSNQLETFLKGGGVFPSQN